MPVRPSNSFELTNQIDLNNSIRFTNRTTFNDLIDFIIKSGSLILSNSLIPSCSVVWCGKVCANNNGRSYAPLAQIHETQGPRSLPCQVTDYSVIA